MALLTLFVGLLLPWLTGALGLRAVEARFNGGVPVSSLRQAGYGFFIGYGVLCLAVLGCNAAFAQISWPGIMTVLALIAIVATAALWRGSGTTFVAPEATHALGPSGKTLLFVLGAWTVLHLLLAAIELLNRPLYPWDAWLAWVYRAKAWFMAGGLADVVSPAAWAVASSPDVYTIDAWLYPALPSVIPYWSALSLGHWSETLINLPVLLGAVALGMALYGQIRESGMAPLAGIVACYLLYSLPLFAAHIALAGYADFWMAGFAGLGFVALLRGALAGVRFQTILGFLLLAAAMLVKKEGVVWFLSALLMQALLTFRWRTNLIATVVLAAAIWICFSLGITRIELPFAGTLGIVDERLVIPVIGSFKLEIHDVWRPYLDNFLLMGNWNLLWALAAAGFLIGFPGRAVVADRAWRAGAVFICIFAATQVFIFGFTNLGIWADTYTAINRLPLHFVPTVIFAVLVMIKSRLALVQPSAAHGDAP
jgi:hypothetical protein